MYTNPIFLTCHTEHEPVCIFQPRLVLHSGFYPNANDLNRNVPKVKSWVWKFKMFLKYHKDVIHGRKWQRSLHGILYRLVSSRHYLIQKPNLFPSPHLPYMPYRTWAHLYISATVGPASSWTGTTSPAFLHIFFFTIDSLCVIFYFQSDVSTSFRTNTCSGFYPNANDLNRNVPKVKSWVWKFKMFLKYHKYLAKNGK
jgi:hypothetical protein